jgi:peptidoglycan hydrolase-like protein with peptidoglycan-binding domain
MRLLVVAFLAMATAITVNALYFQHGPSLAASTASSMAPAVARAGVASPVKTSAQGDGVTAALPSKAPDPKPEQKPSISQAEAPRAALARAPEQPTPLVRSIQKKLARFGYKTVPQDGLAGPETRAAILAVEFAQGRPLSGEPSESVLSALYFFEASGRTTLATSDALERDQKLVKEVQDVLAGLGYTSGPIDGHLDGKTREALKRFEADRRLKGEGRLTERVILEMVIEQGKPLLSKG